MGPIKGKFVIDFGMSADQRLKKIDNEIDSGVNPTKLCFL